VSDDSARDATGRERRDAAADDRRDAATEGDGDDESLVGTRTGRHERVRA